MIASSSSIGCEEAGAPVGVALPPSRSARVSAAAGDRELVGQLEKSEIFRDYQQAFAATVGMPLTIEPADARAWSPLDARHPCCGPAAAPGRRCTGCVELGGWVTAGAHGDSKTVTCRPGLSESAIPIRLGARVFGFLRTGRVQVLPTSPAATAHRPREIDACAARAPMGQQHYEAVLRLVVIFARHLSLVGNQLMVAGMARESPRMARARSFIAEHHGEEFSLVDVAQAVHMSPFYFCKVFKESTGQTFTHHVARVRIEEVKQTLLQRDIRVSEAAFAAGFQSLSQFNRLFRALVGETPSAYRERWCEAGPDRSAGSVTRLPGPTNSNAGRP